MSLVNSLYKTLFGGSGLKDGNLIDFAEHGRVGGVSTGQGYKFVNLAKQAVRVATDSGDSNIEYVGFASIGSSTSDAVWQIMKVDSTSGTVITWADSDDKHDNIWDNRESLTYG